MRSKYFFADPNVIITPPDKAIDLPTEDVSFELSTDQLDKLLKAAAIYQLADLAVEGGDGVVKLLVRDKKNDTSNSFSVTVGETDKVFSFNFKVENIKILPGTYDVSVSSKLLSRFTSKNQDLNLLHSSRTRFYLWIMSKKHSYTNPEDKFDAAYVEAQVTEG